jgi:hypothetical protein
MPNSPALMLLRQFHTDRPQRFAIRTSIGQNCSILRTAFAAILPGQQKSRSPSRQVKPPQEQLSGYDYTGLGRTTIQDLELADEDRIFLLQVGIKP